MLSTRSLVEMEAGEAQLQAAFWERADPPEDAEASLWVLGVAWVLVTTSDGAPPRFERLTLYGPSISRTTTNATYLQALLASVNAAVDRVGSMLDWQLLEFKDGMKALKSPGLDVPAWRKNAEQRAERAFAWLEARADGRLPLPQQLPAQGQVQGPGQRR